jgi:phosphoglycerate-specific signal transduction histidine kinase
LEETNKKGELLKRIEAEATGLDVLKRLEVEATGLDGKINDRDLCVPIDTVRNTLVEASKEITNHLKMANRLRKFAGEDEWHKECHRLFDEWFQKWF